MSSGRVSLRSTTKISLNDRFKILRNTNNGATNSNQPSISNRLSQRHGSNRNKRLALQMANRPSVQAALKIKNRSIKQRLGNVRKGRPLARKPLLRNNNFKNNSNEVNKVIGLKTRGFRLNRNNFVGGNRVGTTQQKRQNLGFKRQNVGRLQASTSFANQRQTRQTQNPRLNLRNKVGIVNKKQLLLRGNKIGGKFGNRNNFKNINTNKNHNINSRRMNTQPRRGNIKGGKFAGRQKFVGKGKFAGKQDGWQPKRNLNKDQLDQDLDAYMAKTKTHLDSDLDAYMASANP